MTLRSLLLSMTAMSALGGVAMGTATAQSLPGFSIEGRTAAAPTGEATIQLQPHTAQPESGGSFGLQIVPRVDVTREAELMLERFANFEASVRLRVRIDPALLPTPQLIEMVDAIGMVDGVGMSIRQGYAIDVTHDVVLGFSGGTAEITSIQATDQGIVILALMRDANGNIVTPPADSLALYTTGGERLCFEEDEITITTTTTQPMGGAPGAAPPVPMTFALLLDRSGSMHSVMDEVKRSAHRFIDALPAGAICAVGAFAAEGGTFDPALGLGTGSCEARNFPMHGVHAGGQTDLYAALERLYPWMNAPERQGHQKALIIITDGGINQSLHLASPVAQMKGDVVTFIYFLGGREERHLSAIADNFLGHEGALNDALGRYFNVVVEAYSRQTVLRLRECTGAAP
jgi:hypothetical protein